MWNPENRLTNSRKPAELANNTSAMLILAPMQGLTELLFRKVYAHCFPGSFDFAVSPFISLTHGILRTPEKKLSDILPECNRDSIPVIPQILGHEPEEFVSMANQIFDLGYDEVNWNLGCPMRRVAHKHRGSGLLPYPDEIRRILDTVVPAIKGRLSVKIRLGYYSADEFDAVAPVLNDFPLASVTIHPRIGKQLYSGRPDFEKLKDVVATIKHTLVYNGDIVTCADYRSIRTAFPQIQHVMIGRGVLYNPLLPSMIRERYANDFPTPEGTLQVVSAQTFVRALTDAIMDMDISQQAKVRKIKEYWCLSMRSLPGTEDYKRRLLQLASLEEILDRIFEMTK